MHVHIHTHTCIHIYMCTYTYTYTYIHTWIHIHTHTHIHVHIHIYIYICLCTHIYIYLYIYLICTSCREREANVYADVHKICLAYTPAHAWCATTPVNACRLFAKKRIWTRVCAPIQLCSSFFAMEAFANSSWVLREHRAGCCLLPALLRSLAALRNVVRARNPSKSSLAYDAVATAVLHKHHLIIRVGAGLIQFSIGRTCAWPRRLPVTEMHFRHFSREFYIYALLRGLMIWAKCCFLLTCLLFLEK